MGVLWKNHKRYSQQCSEACPANADSGFEGLLNGNEEMTIHEKTCEELMLELYICATRELLLAMGVLQQESASMYLANKQSPPSS